MYLNSFRNSISNFVYILLVKTCIVYLYCYQFDKYPYIIKMIQN